MTPAEKLEARLPAVLTYPVGICSEDIGAIRFTADYFDNIIEALASPRSEDVQMGFFFAEHLPSHLLSREQRTRLSDFVTEKVSSREWGIREAAAATFVKLCRQHPGYREIMLPLLTDPTGMVRRVALKAFPTYAGVEDIELLLPFERDDYATEVGMGSYLVFELRNIALEIIESLIGKHFQKGEKTVSLPDENVGFWWDWGPFHKWRKSIWRKFLPY